MDRPAAWRALAIDLEEERPFRIGGAAINPVSRDAELPGGKERLQPQNLKVLIALVRRKGEVVTRSELIDSCWDGRIIGEDVINRSISVLRDFAGRAGGFSIETVPKTGYRLTELKPVHSAPIRALRWSLAAGLLAAIALGAWLAPGEENPADPTPPVVALRPFTSSNDPSARELAAASADTLSHMMVAGSSHGKLSWPASTNDAAAADVIMTGDVRRTGDELAVLVQARDRRTGTVLLSRHYEAPVADAALLPQQIGAEISTNLTGVLALVVLDRRHSKNPELTAERLKTIAMTVAGEDPLGGYEISRRVAEKHPDWLLAQLGVAYDTSFALGSLPGQDRPEAVSKARIAADMALRMAPDFGDSYAPWCTLHPSTRGRECEDRLRAGMKADPDAPTTPGFLSDLLFDVGRFEESSQFARIALAGRPFHPQKLRRVVRTLIVLGHKEDAEQIFSKAMKWWPRHGGLHWDRIYGYAIRGDLDGAKQAIDQVPPSVLEGPRAAIVPMLRAYRADDRDQLRAICTKADADYLLRNLCLTALHQSGDRESALMAADQLFRRALGASAKEDEALWLDNPWLGIEPMLSSPATAWLRVDPQFLVLAKRSGALRYWRGDRLPDFCRPPGEPVCARLRKAG